MLVYESQSLISKGAREGVVDGFDVGSTDAVDGVSDGDVLRVFEGFEDGSVDGEYDGKTLGVGETFIVIVGPTLGTAEGSSDDKADGLNDTLIVGPTLGIPEGLLDDNILGPVDGREEILIDGLIDGLDVGDDDGADVSSVGIIVGDALGNADGTSDNDIDGDSDGWMLGMSVGS